MEQRFGVKDKSPIMNNDVLFGILALEEIIQLGPVKQYIY